MSASLVEELKLRATRRAENRPMWLQKNHAEHVDVEGIDGKEAQLVDLITVHASVVGMGETFVAHFRLFLKLSDSENSFELNSYGLQRMATRLKVIFREYPWSTARSTMGTLNIPTKSSFTVQGAISELLSKNRDHYTLDSTTGSGCRYWCEVAISDFINRGWVGEEYADSVEKLTAKIKAMEKYKHVNIPVPAPRGTFLELSSE